MLSRRCRQIYQILRLCDLPRLYKPRHHQARWSRKSGTIIFVHGILSNCASCFENMLRSFRNDERFSGFSLGTFDYDYDNDMATSSENLTEFINDTSADTPVTLVSHSMGGLVARLAVLSGKVRVKRLIMLGTPNFGAIRTAQLGLLSQIALRLAGKIYAVFRNPGIRDLTRVTEVFRDPIAMGRQFARHCRVRDHSRGILQRIPSVLG